MSQGRKLVIVESPAKARTISAYLGADFDVEASVGHIRDLPQPSELPAEMKKSGYGKFAVDVDNGFAPYYEVYPDKKKKVTELRRLLKDADELYLATDEDREGEAIAWHLLEALKPKVPVKRMVFHEITREAIQRALTTTRDLDERLVDAQETRRILDRLYGYEVSPVLWRKVRQGLSAGRVQSVATRLVVERERERMAFVPASYWDVTAQFEATQGQDAGGTFQARLTHVDGTRVATGRDFTDRGELKARDVVHLTEDAATTLAQSLTDAPATVASLDTKPYTRRPAAPFTTSTLQQEASRKLRMSSKTAMRVAQTLYENGYITYMRTDSPALSAQAISAARSQAADLYGTEFVPEKPRHYASKSKGAQEAHEAIRPAGDTFRTPAQVANVLSGDQFRLYELIWKRTVASQMADARGSTASVRIDVPGQVDGQTTTATFSASGTVITFRGFLAAYEEGRDVDRYDDGSQSDGRLPHMVEGDPLASRDVSADGHTTTPPPRFTEASLVKALEERGIGRPSTYASTISTIQDRGYVNNRGQALVPSWLAFSVIRLLEEHFSQLIDYDFTAQMESDLDEIAAGQGDRVNWLTQFYFGGAGGDKAGLKELVEGLGDIDAREINTVSLGEGIVLRVGRYGPYIEHLTADTAEGENPPRASVPDDIAPDELTLDVARDLLENQKDGDIELGSDPVSGHMIVAKSGRFGPYVTEIIPEPELDESMSAAAKKKAKAALPKPRTASLFKSHSLTTITLDEALQLLSLPRVVGVDPDTGTEITANNGRYGPYLKKGTDSRTITSEEQLLTITLDEALEIYKQPKRGRGATASAPLRELGVDPTSEKPIVIKDGRFGPYVTDGKTNRTLPKDATVESVTFEQAVELLAEKRAKAPVKRATRTTAKKSTATKKTTTTAAKKTPAKKTTATKKTQS
ncbi:type I DNA topoisomerase [Jonesia denitrificans]|uniref:DNA topoisomerase 1 n=1 Tax=Jonesia denitrificans (strain ATCC 14870 / DSM 20603 / BCRC 15368 / CIP 55.134 / JCM 11481 / NBRC 15587 / NCTC 10816 / Prevot 55134) TaxID=471856 RepID=C7R1J9_JONDD|nr:type I DNA topoisomerase [Jonesia denitrificans]ACV09834.1 DNA topoisomerase I [Jonesia denitrificans DSM 20603]ASE10100.1 type I DNA topoisomerase [Jonesia denitrificans]QXB43514.1 type I DNA topoisomerase [Jonesia denitrificans]SQH22485.1 DNA topoisomerase 1 [Jonesia denitrificans]